MTYDTWKATEPAVYEDERPTEEDEVLAILDRLAQTAGPTDLANIKREFESIAAAADATAHDVRQACEKANRAMAEIIARTFPPR